MEYSRKKVCVGADALLNSVFSFAGWHVAEKLIKPAIAAYWCPVTSSRHPPPSTAAAGLRAGVPNVIVPFFCDQPFWGWRVHQLGAGPRWIPRPKLTAEKLATAIQQAVSDQDMRRRASQVGASIQAENGVKTAIGLIEQFARV